MSKRRITKKQTSRINLQQDAYQTEFSSSGQLLKGLVISRYGRQVMLESEDKELIACALRPNLQNVVTGDWVIWQKEGAQQGVILSCLPRKTVLGRPNKQGLVKPVAANISQMMIVVAAKPEISWPLLDSYLVSAEYLKLKACIILNKIDLESQAIKNRLKADYQNLPYPILFVSKNDEKSVHDLLAQLSGETSVFVGQSGVGKSSIIASLLTKENNIATQTISERSELGKHTTSNSTYYHLPLGGALIDSPGVREFGLWHMSGQDIAHGYPEFRRLLQECKFRNCKHESTPGCALLKAKQEGSVSENRYDNFIKLVLQFAH